MESAATFGEALGAPRPSPTQGPLPGKQQALGSAGKGKSTVNNTLPAQTHPPGSQQSSGNPPWLQKPQHLPVSTSPETPKHLPGTEGGLLAPQTAGRQRRALSRPPRVVRGNPDADLNHGLKSISGGRGKAQLEPKQGLDSLGWTEARGKAAHGQSAGARVPQGHLLKRNR